MILCSKFEFNTVIFIRVVLLLNLALSNYQLIIKQLVDLYTHDIYRILCEYRYIWNFKVHVCIKITTYLFHGTCPEKEDA